MREFQSPAGGLNSVYPCTEYLTFGPWIYCVPQYKPDNVLILGYGGGTTAGLIRLIYGDVDITGVDIEPCENLYGVNIINQDARDFVPNMGFYDCIIVDLWDDLKPRSPLAFITEPEFAKTLMKKGNYLIFHVLKSTEMSTYKGVKLLKTLQLNDSIFYYFVRKRIPQIPIA